MNQDTEECCLDLFDKVTIFRGVVFSFVGIDFFFKFRTLLDTLA